MPIPETAAVTMMSALLLYGEIGESVITITRAPRSLAASMTYCVERAYGAKLKASSTSPASISISGPEGTGPPSSKAIRSRTRSRVTDV